MLGKKVKVIVDRTINSVHPKCENITYTVNYGYVLEASSIYDKEYLDAYILDEDEPVEEYHGQVIAIIHRENDEEKLVVANKSFSKEEIEKKVSFIEKYFKHYIELNITTKEDIKYDLANLGIKTKDNLMIHSSLKSFGKINPNDIIEAFIETVNDGLVIFPTHTWNIMKNDGDIFDVDLTDSCVGALTNIARKYPGFKRSMHPTHSVCAHGKMRDEYLAWDLNVDTPVNPKGCFGRLKDINAKIIFLGAPLTKNTFIHSIEEEFLVPDRFTEHIYHFVSKNGEKTLDYYMPKHYSTKNPHLSEHYQKLLRHLLTKGIAKEGYVGNSHTYVVDAYQCYSYVEQLLEKNLHIFDNYDDYED